jgi:protein MpaA
MLGACTTPGEPAKPAEAAAEPAAAAQDAPKPIDPPVVNVAAKIQAAPAPAPAAPEKAKADPAIQKWCTELSTAMKGFRWQLEGCKFTDWKVAGTSVKGRPLVYAEFGDLNSKNTTLVLAMVHGDEITPLYLGLSLVNWVAENQASLNGMHVVIAPLVNPDGFYATPRTRMNARGVDINRNFATHDWEERALQAWKTKFGSDPRRFPGSASRSEPETVFQDELVRKLKPQKILSIHAPLNFMDYDGPTGLSLKRFPAEYVKRCLELRQNLRAKSGGFFPGSLGNFTGQEMGIPTLTLELPTADSGRAYRYWLMFRKGIRQMIEFTVPASAGEENAKSS